MIDTSLAGRRIAVPETRELDIFADLLTRRGAEVLRCPLVSILDAPDPAPVLDWISAFNAGEMDDLILYTGEGLRRLLSCMERHAPELRAPFVARLAQVRTLTRGPKPARVLRELGLRPTLTATAPTTEGIIAALAEWDLSGRCVGIQTYGRDVPPTLVDFYYQRGIATRQVSPYIYADATHDTGVMKLIDQLNRRMLDAIAFTSQAQVERLWAVAARGQQEASLKDGLQHCCIAAVGPVVAQALQERGVRVDLMPQEAYFLKPLTQKLADFFETGSDSV